MQYGAGAVARDADALEVLRPYAPYRDKGRKALCPLSRSYNCSSAQDRLERSNVVLNLCTSSWLVQNSSLLFEERPRKTPPRGPLYHIDLAELMHDATVPRYWSTWVWLDGPDSDHIVIL
jgi:hypothetical protein